MQLTPVFLFVAYLLLLSFFSLLSYFFHNLWVGLGGGMILTVVITQLSYRYFKALLKVADEDHFYENILNEVPQGIILVKENDHCIFQNKITRDLFGKIDLQMNRFQFLKDFIKNTQLTESTLIFDSKELYIAKIAEFGNVRMLALELSEQKKVQQIGKEFVANASHELRTPITIIKGFAETLNDLPQISDVMLRDFTEKILRNCQRMDNLVKNLLLLADLDHSSRLKLRLCDLGVFIENVSYNLLSVHKDVVIETLMSEEFITVQMDPDLFEQAIFNLLENAVKYSPQPAQITLIVEKKESEVVLKVKDKGVGIKLEHLPYIFNRFFRVNNDRSRKLGGAGLGLSIVKSIIEKHQATLQVSSVEGEGTTFEITLPAPVSSSI